MARKLTEARCKKALDIVAAWLGPRMGHDGPAPTGREAADNAEGPMLLMEWDWPSSGPTPTVILEGGPFEWTYEIGPDIQPKLDKLGIFCELYAGYALCLYPAGV